MPNTNIKVKFESPKHPHHITFETSKYLQQAKLVIKVKMYNKYAVEKVAQNVATFRLKICLGLKK
jgi:hypothetical protein